MKENSNFTFAPQLYIQHGVTNIDFYLKAFGAVEFRRILNDDSSIHVAELSIQNALFHIHEEVPDSGFIRPEKHNESTVKIGLFVPDVDDLMKNAISYGATLISPAQDYDYGYRQGEFRDPFGHTWLIEMNIGRIRNGAIKALLKLKTKIHNEFDNLKPLCVIYFNTLVYRT